MVLDGALPEVQHVREFAVGVAASEQTQDVQLALGQAGFGLGVFRGVCLDSIDLNDATASVDVGSGMTYDNNAGKDVNLNCG